jgi:hypothetical protein
MADRILTVVLDVMGWLIVLGWWLHRKSHKIASMLQQVVMREKGLPQRWANPDQQIE